VIPADPAMHFAGGPKAQPETIERIRVELHLNEPILVQYFYYLNDLIHFDLGKSYLESRPVTDSLAQYFPATLELTIFAMLISIPLGIVGGIISAVKRNKLSDHITRFIAIVGYSLPIFWLAQIHCHCRLFFADILAGTYVSICICISNTYFTVRGKIIDWRIGTTAGHGIICHR
jgi:peptide/nickel transport system permease protein